MSKVKNNDEIREATPQEETMIGQDGGGNNRYELIATKEISEPIGLFDFRSLDNKKMSCVVFEMLNMTGTTSQNLILTLALSNSTQLGLTINSFFNESVPRNINIIVERKTNRIFSIQFEGTVGKDTLVKRISSDIETSFEDVFKTLYIGIGNRSSGSLITDGTVNLYGIKGE